MNIHKGDLIFLENLQGLFEIEMSPQTHTGNRGIKWNASDSLQSVQTSANKCLVHEKS